MEELIVSIRTQRPGQKVVLDYERGIGESAGPGHPRQQGRLSR